VAWAIAWENRELGAEPSGVDTTGHVLELTRKALDEFGRVPLSTSTRTAARIARLMEDHENLWWLDWELRDLTNAGDRSEVLFEVAPALSEARLNKLHTDYRKRYEDERAMWGSLNLRDPVPPPKDKVCCDSVAVIEQKIAAFGLVHGLVEGYAVPLLNMRKVADEKMIAELNREQFSRILNNISTRVYAYLSRVEVTLAFTEVQDDILGAHVRRTNLFLHSVAPDVLAKFTSVYRRIAEGDVEALSHAAVSCRRILKAVADLLYPPSDRAVRDDDGVEHPVTDADFVNRLVTYAATKMRSRNGNTFKAALDDLARRIGAVNDLASTGVHVEVSTVFEANQCALQTYMIAGDILALESYGEQESPPSG
jgi:hypothetical protein